MQFHEVSWWNLTYIRGLQSAVENMKLRKAPGTKNMSSQAEPSCTKLQSSHVNYNSHYKSEEKMKGLLNLVQRWNQLEEELNTYRYHTDLMEGTWGPKNNLTWLV